VSCDAAGDSACDADDAEPPTCRFSHTTSLRIGARSPQPRDATDALAARGVARLSALADWLDGEEPSGVVVSLVRAFLQDVGDVAVAVDDLLAAGDAVAPSAELAASLQSLALAVGLWRTNLVEHVDDLALSSYRSLSGWSSLPEYSVAYALAMVEPALAEAEAWATVSRGVDGAGNGQDGLGLASHVRGVRASVRRLNATLRTAVSPPAASSFESASDAVRPDSPLLAAAW